MMPSCLKRIRSVRSPGYVSSPAKERVKIINDPIPQAGDPYRDVAEYAIPDFAGMDAGHWS
jgi:hypothetical protein